MWAFTVTENKSGNWRYGLSEQIHSCVPSFLEEWNVLKQQQKPPWSHDFSDPTFLASETTETGTGGWQDPTKIGRKEG